MSEEYDKQRRHELHANNLNQQGQTQQEKAVILKELSEIDDLPITPESDPVMGQLVSKLTSTANLSEEQVQSNEWVREYILLLYLCKYPKPGGLSGAWRGYAKADYSAEREPLDAETRTELETFVSTSKIALSRSEDAKVMEEGARDISESVTHDDASNTSGSGGLLGRIRS